MNPPLAVCAVLLALAVLGSSGTTCTRARTPEQCAAISVRCRQPEERVCEQQYGGEFLPHGGFCGFCSLCVRYVGANQRCNTTTDSYTTSICTPPLVCTGNDGRCVQECTKYDN